MPPLSVLRLHEFKKVKLPQDPFPQSYFKEFEKKLKRIERRTVTDFVEKDPEAAIQLFS